MRLLLVSVTASYDAHRATSVIEMPLTRLRESIFPNVPPYLTFISPNDKYDDGEEPPEELVIHFTVAYGTSKTVLECINRFGARIVEVKLIKINKVNRNKIKIGFNPLTHRWSDHGGWGGGIMAQAIIKFFWAP